MKTLEQWLLELEQLHPKAIDLQLTRVASVAQELNLTHFDCPVVTVGGTNGKGSCVRFLDAIVTKAGYRVGSYTSPHLLNFNERIRIDAQFSNNTSLCEAFEVIEVARKSTTLTFFEYTTLAALWLFKQKSLDLIILEVGLGGRLDAVNLVDPDIAIISSISLDHLDWLGATREDIGFEKAGIFRPHRAAICGDREPPYTVRNQALHLESKLYEAGKHFDYQEEQGSWRWFSDDWELHDLPLPHLPIQNAATSLMGIKLLKEQLHITSEDICHGIKTARLPGRFQIIDNPFPCILDVAHNPASGQLLADRLKLLNENIIAVVGMLNDKDITNTLAPLVPLVSRWYCGSLNCARGCNCDVLQSKLQDFGVNSCYTFPSVTKAFEAATKQLKKSDRVLVFGSFYTVAEIMSLIV